MAEPLLLQRNHGTSSELDLGPTISSSSEDNLKDVIKRVFESLMSVKGAYLASIRENTARFEKFISPGKSIKEETFSFLSVLRKWNSYTPVLPANGAHTRGGGYFVYHKGVGIAIDPGYNFVQNFFENNFKLDDIDVVIITHAHNDHTVELESIFSLLYKRNREQPEEAHKKIDLYLNLGTFKKYAAYFDLSHKNYPNYIRNIVLIDSHNEYMIPKDSFDSDLSIITTKTQHHEMITTSYALGFVLKCGDRTIRFTGDTGWNETIERKNDQLLEFKQIDKVDILVPHLGSIKESEFNFDHSKSIEENIKKGIFYEQHLGILGCICMIHNSRPDLVIFSEFGEELKAIRNSVVSKLSDAISIPCLPGDIGLCVRLVDLAFFCFKSGTMNLLSDIEIYEVKDDLFFVSSSSFTEAERANKNATVQSLTKKTISEIISS
ncbi:MAG: MBL fold metallo-hydrolase [Nitrospirota bacterium]